MINLLNAKHDGGINIHTYVVKDKDFVVRFQTNNYVHKLDENTWIYNIEVDFSLKECSGWNLGGGHKLCQANEKIILKSKEFIKNRFEEYLV